MISDLGLLTPAGMEYFYPIFKDMQNWLEEDYNDLFPDLPFPNKPRNHGEKTADEYRERLLEKNYTRVCQVSGSLLNFSYSVVATQF